MVSNTLYLLCCALGILHMTEAKCSQRLASYWKRKYFKNYFEDLEPWRRCKEERGTCMRKPDSCGSGDWKRYQTTCYNRCDCCFRKKRNSKYLDWVLVEKRLTWEEARNDCWYDKNGDLVVPESVADLLRFIKKKNIGSVDVWIGINDKFNGRFEGIHGNKVVSGWMEGQPRRATSKKDNCVVVENHVSHKREENRKGMKVEPCWARNYYVCDVNRSNRNMHDVLYIKSDWDDHGSGGAFHGNFNLGECIIDSQCRSNERCQLGRCVNQCEFARCGEGARCQVSRRQAQCVCPENTQGDPLERCQPKTEMNINHLGWFLVKKRLTWKEARKACRGDKNGELVVPEDVANLLRFIEKENIGTADVWIGINEKFNGHFEGIHGNKVVGGWMEGQPLRATSKKDNCVVVENASSKRKGKRLGMKVEPCWARNYYVCDVNGSNRKMHDVVYKSNRFSSDEDGSGEVYSDDGEVLLDDGEVLLDDGEVYFDEYILLDDAEATFEDDIKIFGNRKTWYQARADCQEMGGDLLVPPSLHDLMSFIKNTGIEEREIWLGISDHRNPGYYSGIHGNKILGKSLWQSLQPFEQKRGYDCVAIANGDIMGKGLKVKYCNKKAAYACDLSSSGSSHPIAHQIDTYMDLHLGSDRIID